MSSNIVAMNGLFKSVYGPRPRDKDEQCYNCQGGLVAQHTIEGSPPREHYWYVTCQYCHGAAVLKKGELVDPYEFLRIGLVSSRPIIRHNLVRDWWE